MSSAAELLLSDLRTCGTETHDQTLKFLVKSRQRRAVEALRLAMTDSDEALKIATIEILEARGGWLPVELLTQALSSDSNSNVRIQAAEALGSLGNTRAVATLIQALEDSEPLVRLCSAESLGILKARKAISALVGLLSDRDVLVRAYAAGALGEIGQRKAVAPLLSRLKTERNTRVRLAYYHALYLLGNSSYFARILRLLSASHYRTRCAAANLLTEVATEASISQIEDALRSALQKEPTIAAASVFRKCLRELEELRQSGLTP